MIKANIEFDNKIASPLSPIEFINRKIFNQDVKFIDYDEKSKTAIFALFSNFPSDEQRLIMTIKIKNMEQI